MSEQTQDTATHDEATQQYIRAMNSQIEIAEAGYQGFRRMYAQTNAKPKPKAFHSRLGILRTALMVIMVAGSIVSASHTIPTFMGETVTIFSLLVGLAAFFMSEVALAAFAYVGVMRHYRATQKEPESLKTLVLLGVVVPFVVMAAANINHEFALNGQALPDVIKTGIVLAISLSAPFMSYISGEVFAMFEVIDRVDQEKHDKDYAALDAAWEERCRLAWAREKGNYGGKIKVDPVPAPALSYASAVLSDQTRQDKTATDTRQTGAMGFTRVSLAVDTARQWLEANKDQANQPLRVLEPLVGVSKDSIGKARNQLIAEGKLNIESTQERGG